MYYQTAVMQGMMGKLQHLQQQLRRQVEPVRKQSWRFKAYKKGGIITYYKRFKKFSTGIGTYTIKKRKARV